MKAKKEPKYKLVSIGQGGSTLYKGRWTSGTLNYGGSRCEGYYTDPLMCCQKHAHELEVGSYVIDKIAAIDTPEGYSWVFKGPMVDVDLEPNTVEACPTPSPIMAQAMAGNQFGQLLALQEVHKAASPEPGPLDSVDIETYVAGWRKVGAKIGKWNGLTIDWE